MLYINGKVLNRELQMKISEEISYNCCPICNSFYEKWRSKVTEAGKFNIVKCKQCGYAFINPRPSHNYLMSYYSKEGHRAGVSVGEKATIDSVLKQEAEFPNSTVDAKRIMKTVSIMRGNTSKVANRFLDIGCGYGFFSKEALGNKYAVTALELASTEKSIAQKMTGVNPIQSSFEEFSEKAGSYDVILMSQILEHALDVNGWISKASTLLADQGILVIALPNFMSIFRLILKEREPYICPPDHLNFFSLKNLVILMNKNGLSVEKVQYVSRISPKALLRRLSSVKLLYFIIAPVVKVILKIIDFFRLGMMVNIYAKKTE